jgi:hypothetical protein
MRPFTLSVALAAALGAAGLGTVRAQDPYYGPPVDYTTARAYHHFLTSPYSYRTYSRSFPGYTVEGYTPYGYERVTRDPGYLHERITPYGFERYRVVPGYHATVVVPAVGPYYGPPYAPAYPPYYDDEP